ncbi:MAG: uncharacterized protein KVP18_002316 [Porospora cf. gigantea A]|uniref:uncharacterized protein n=1 Tax=Porospora cf. gigantea A TaxID=2853593 RepID=UPI00355A17BC|nr:MAG: hypothetical protein KVP18_002316 [Porospora cf. gigantea A]
MALFTPVHAHRFPPDSEVSAEPVAHPATQDAESSSEGDLPSPVRPPSEDLQKYLDRGWGEADEAHVEALDQSICSAAGRRTDDDAHCDIRFDKPAQPLERRLDEPARPLDSPNTLRQRLQSMSNRLNLDAVANDEDWAASFMEVVTRAPMNARSAELDAANLRLEAAVRDLKAEKAHFQAIVNRYVEFVEAGDLEMARSLVGVIRSMMH